MRVLCCGLNPSLVAADDGVGYAGRTNRFWPIAVTVGLASRQRDPLSALAQHGTGMTDLVKRATPSAATLTPAEYRKGAERVRRLVEWLHPGIVLFVGLSGWRAAIEPKAALGIQPGGFGGRPAYVMPSTSGRNAHASASELANHMRRALALSHQEEGKPPS
jgi:TDG/mug DNA glycosylase family protein